MSSRVPFRTTALGDYRKELARLHRAPGYVPRSQFLRNTSWVADNENEIKVLSESDGITPLVCIVTGIVSEDKLKCSSVGDCDLSGDPLLPSVPLNDARIRFSLTQSTHKRHALFSSDFDSTVRTIHRLTDVLPDVDCRVHLFLTIEKNGDWHLNFEYKIFQQKYLYTDSEPNDNLEPIDLRNYAVPTEYKHLLEELKPAYYARRLPVVDCSNELIDESKQAGLIVRNLVQVGFNMKFDPKYGLRGEAEWIIVMD